MATQRTPPKKKAQQLAKHLRCERPDYTYLKKLFYHLRNELEVEVKTKPKKLPTVPSEEEIQRLYDVVWKSKRFGDMVIKLFYTLEYASVNWSTFVYLMWTFQSVRYG